MFDRLHSYSLKLKALKCKPFRKETQSLVCIVSTDDIKAHPEKLSAIANWSRPRDMKDVRSFLGFASHNRDFNKGFAGLAKTLQ